MPDNLHTSFAGADTQSWLKMFVFFVVVCFVSVVFGVFRGLSLPVANFLKSLDDRALYLPSSAFLVAIDGRYSGSIDEGFAYADPDMRMVPDTSTLCVAPGNAGKAYVFADTFHMDDRPW